MKIVIREEGEREPAGKRTFDEPVLRVGRDGSACHLVFDGSQWPMVSRRHAEFSAARGRCLLVDLGSTLGTFVDGHRISGPMEVRAGSRVRVGADGPVVRIVSIEAAPIPHAATAGGSATLERIIGTAGNGDRFQIAREVTCLGRDPGVDVRFDACETSVSRRHAEIRRRGDQFVLVDLGSVNGTSLNGERITAPTPLSGGDLIQLGDGGPILRFSTIAEAADPGHHEKATVAEEWEGGGLHHRKPIPAGVLSRTSVQRRFKGRPFLSVGRAPDNDIQLDLLQISKHHARFHRSGDRISVEDLHSTNGVYVEGERIRGRRDIRTGEVVQIGPFTIEADPRQGISVTDTRANAPIHALGVVKEVPKGRLLEGIDLAIQPNEFVGLLGPSGAGKSTLMDAMNGMRPATRGRVLINRLDLYRHLAALKQSIGYVPQDDIIHRELTVYRTLYYVARLRLSRDVTQAEIDRILDEVMDLTGLSERSDIPVRQLSGGQRKRVSIAVELITKPAVIFLDEPTSGLDPATEEKIMHLFRRIANQGHTVVLTTHAMENVKLFDKVVVLMHGRLVFYGAPGETLSYFRADSFKDLYDRLEAPVNERVAQLPSLPRMATKEQKKARTGEKERIEKKVAEKWEKSYHRTEEYDRHIVRPLKGLERENSPAAPAQRRLTLSEHLHQLAVLASRQVQVLAGEKWHKWILLALGPIIAVMTHLGQNAKRPPDSLFFVLALAPLFFGLFASVREIIRERAVYNRERMVNLSLFSYIGSKTLVLSLVVGIQCALLFGTLALLDTENRLPRVEGNLGRNLGGLEELGVMILTGMVGVALGLFVSAWPITSETALSLLAVILLPQLVLGGLLGPPEGVARGIGAAMPVTWSFDEIKRLSGYDSCRQSSESDPSSSTPPDRPSESDPPPPTPPGCVTFLHEWGGNISNPVKLALMLLFWSGSSILVLRWQDVRR